LWVACKAICSLVSFASWALLFELLAHHWILILP
jgi:hypothetical protein